MVAQTNPPVILTASPDDIAFDRNPGSSYSDELTLVGTATPNSTITVYDGSTVLGTATTNSAGVWSYATSSLTDGTHSFTATATLAGVTSAASSAMVQNVVGEITNFSPLTDQWSAPISVGGMPYYVENANINGNAPWAITQVDSHTLRFQVRPDDVWPDNDSHRSEISGGTIFSAKSTINLSYQLTVQPGFNDTSNGLAWQILGQFHADDNDPTYQTISGGSPPLAFHLTGANGYGEGDYLAIQAFYALPGQTAWTAATTPGDTLNGYLWVSQAPIVRGQPIDIQLEVNFQNNSSGFLEVWINGQQVVDYHGAIGYGGGVYWKEGIYEGWSSNQTITADFANTVITSAPGAPLILGNVVNGNQVMLKGTAQANSTISIYDGATKLGTVTTSSSGSWFYETGALSVGGHNLTATATDSAGNVGAASTAASATISAFTGPMITSVVTSAPTGETVTGTTITFTLKMSSAVSVTGTPTLSLNDGGTAVYKSGSGTNSLTFTYTVGANDSSTKGLGITGANLPGGASITDSGGNAAILTGASVQFPGVTIDTQPVQTPVFGDPVDNGNGTFTFTGTAGANTTVYFSTPYGSTLGNASVDSTGHWTFTTPTLAGNTWNSIQAYDVNSLGDISSIGSENGIGFGNDSNLPPSPTITGNALVGNVATLYGTVTAGYSITTVAIFDGTTQIGTATVNGDNTWSFSTAALANGAHSFSAESKSSTGTSSGSVPDSITVGTVASAVDTTAPTVSSVAASGTGITSGSGSLNAGDVVTLTLNLSEVVTVAGGTPTLTLNDGGVATYAGGSGTSALTFSYTVGAGQNTSDLAVTAVNLNAATVKDGAGNAANLAGAVTNPSGTLQIDTTAPTVSSVAASGTGITSGSGSLNAGDVVTLTLNLSEVVTVAGGTPTLTLNDGGVATYAGGSGTSALIFSYTVGAGQNTSDLAVTAVNLNSASVKDSAGNTANLAGAVTNPSGTLQIDTTAPTVSSVAASGAGITSGSGSLNAGDVVTLTLNLSEVVTVAGGTPTLTLNDGGVATYAGGSGTSALTFSYTVGAGQNTSDLAVTAVNLNAATVKDGAGNAANLAGAVTNPSGTLQIDTTAPVISAISETPSTGALNAGKIVAYTITMSEVVTVNTAGGTPTLSLNDGGIATYVGGSGTNALTFSYTVLPGQNTPDLMVSAFNLNGASVTDGASNSANLSLTGIAQGSPSIDTTTPTVSSVAASGTGITSGSGSLNAGDVVTLTLNLSEAVTVAGGTPTLTLNDGGVATYAGGSGTNALTFSYTVGAGQNTSDLTVTTVNLNSASVKDSAGNTADLAGAVTNPSGTLQIDTTAPTVASLVASGGGITTGNPATGSVVTMTMKFTEAVIVAGGTPTLTLTNGGAATYTGGSGTNTLTFSYTVGAGQDTSSLVVASVNLNSATVKDSAGNNASLAMTPVAGGGPAAGGGSSQPIDNTAPTVASMVASGNGITSGSGKLNTGKVVTLTVNLSEAVTVAGGTPTLTLNDGGVATYAGGSGTNALTFRYTVGAGQNTSDLAVMTVNLNAATVKDSAGNAANLAGAVTNPSGTLQIDTTAPTVSSVAASGTRITAGGGTLAFGGTVTLTVKFSEVVTVAGGTPTLTLNDGGRATYTGGSGTNALTFSYTVGAGQNTSDLAVTAVNLNAATVTDSAGNAANLAGAVTNPSGTLHIDTKINLAIAGDNYLLLDSTGAGPSLKLDGASLSIANDFTWYKPIAAVRTATGYDVALKANGSSQYMIASVDANGNWTTNLTSIVSGTSSTLQSYESLFHADLNGDGVIVLSGSGTKISSGSLVVGSGATVEIPGAYSGTVSFAGATGTLIIDDSTKFAGSFRGQLARGDVIDLTDIAGGANASLSYSGNASRGTLTVSDGTHSAKLAVVGNYSLGNFIASSDGNGGTSIVDPPLSGSTSVGAPSEGTAAWLAAVDQRLALWSQHVASAFPTSSVIDSGGFHANGSDLGGQNSQLTMPVQRPQSNHTWG